jgi:hypothetical protein
MPIRALTLQEVAEELGLPTRRFYIIWRQMVAKQGFPRPLVDGETPKWCPAQLYAWMDRGLTKQQRVAAAAYRAAFEAVNQPDASLIDTSVTERRSALEARFVRSTGA